MKNLSISNNKVSCVSSNSEKVKKILFNGTQVFSSDCVSCSSSLPNAPAVTFEDVDFDYITENEKYKIPPITLGTIWFQCVADKLGIPEIKGKVTYVDDSGSVIIIKIDWGEMADELNEAFPEDITISTQVPKSKNEYNLSNTCCYKDGNFEGYKPSGNSLSIELQSYIRLHGCRLITCCGAPTISYFPKTNCVSLQNRRKYGKDMKCPEYVVNETPYTYSEEGISYPFTRVVQTYHDEFLDKDVCDGVEYRTRHLPFRDSVYWLRKDCKISQEVKVGCEVTGYFATTCISNDICWYGTNGVSWNAGCYFDDEGKPHSPTASVTRSYLYQNNIREKLFEDKNINIYDPTNSVHMMLEGVDLNNFYTGKCMRNKVCADKVKLKKVRSNYYGLDWFEITDYETGLSYIPNYKGLPKNGDKACLVIDNCAVFCCTDYSGTPKKVRMTDVDLPSGLFTCNNCFKLEAVMGVTLLDKDGFSCFGGCNFACNYGTKYKFVPDTSLANCTNKNCVSYFDINTDKPFVIPLTTCVESDYNATVRAPTGYYNDGDVACVVYFFEQFEIYFQIYSRYSGCIANCLGNCIALGLRYDKETQNYCSDKIYQCYIMLGDNITY